MYLIGGAGVTKRADVLTARRQRAKIRARGVKTPKQAVSAPVSPAVFLCSAIASMAGRARIQDPETGKKRTDLLRFSPSRPPCGAE